MEKQKKRKEKERKQQRERGRLKKQGWEKQHERNVDREGDETCQQSVRM